MRLIIAGVLLGVSFCLFVVVGVVLVAWVNSVEQGWEDERYHREPTQDPPAAHQEDGPP